MLLKLYQRLGRALPLTEAPRSIVEHIAKIAGVPATSLVPEAYDHWAPSSAIWRPFASICTCVRMAPPRGTQ